MKKVLHEATEVTLENGETRVYEDWDLVKCKDGVERTIGEILDKGLEIE